MPAAAIWNKTMRFILYFMTLHLPYALQAQEVLDELPLPVDNSLAASFEFWPVFFNMLLMLVGILALLLAASWVLKRVMTQRLNLANSSHRIEIVERRGLHSKAALYLLRVDDQEILAAESSDGLRTLAHWKKSHAPSNPSQ